MLSQKNIFIRDLFFHLRSMALLIPQPAVPFSQPAIPRDAVERVRAIRNRQYEETKDLPQETKDLPREEKQALMRKRMDQSVAEFEKRMANTKPDYNRFPFLRKNGKPNTSAKGNFSKGNWE